MNDLQIRSYDGAVSLKERTISGVAAIFDEPYQLKGDIWEVIKRSAMDEADLTSTRALMNHNVDMELASVEAGDLFLTLTGKELQYRFNMDEEEPLHGTAAYRIKKKRFKGSSWGFYAKSHWEKDGIRKLHVVDKVGVVRDVSPVYNAANINTSINLRSMDAHFETWVRLEKLKQLHK